MTYQLRPAVREKTPLIIGIAGPTKSGKTFSAHRLAAGLANGGLVAMINAEGARGHQYAKRFRYQAIELRPPFRPTEYTAALKACAAANPAVVIIDSASHMHDGPGGLLEWHEELVKKMSGGDDKKADRVTFAAWVDPKAAENEFIYTMLGLACPVILCFRAKEKIKIRKGSVEELGWQPIAGERVAFETIFTLMLPPHSRGVPDLEISELREPFDAMIPKGRQIDEDLGRELAKWAAGDEPRAVDELLALLVTHGLNAKDADTRKRCGDLFQEFFGTRSWSAITGLADEDLREKTGKLRARLEPTTTDAGAAHTPAVESPEAEIRRETAEAIRIALQALKKPLDARETVALFEDVVGAATLEGADVTALADLLNLLRRYNANDAVAVKTIDKHRKAGK